VGVPDEAARRIRAAWPGEHLTVVADAREFVTALFAERLASVVQAVWSESAFLACLEHDHVWADMMLALQRRASTLSTTAMPSRTARRTALGSRAANPMPGDRIANPPDRCGRADEGAHHAVGAPQSQRSVRTGSTRSTRLAGMAAATAATASSTPATPASVAGSAASTP
jgi:hypothetical protein